jgi:peptidoglycan/LPS O-acetylase OafA/YrhL
MFVILSGIGIGLSRAGGGPGLFLARRFMRIYPAYWVALTAALVANARVLGIHFETGDIVAHYLGIHAFLGDGDAMSISDSFWFVSLILFLYVVYASLWKFRDRPDWLLFLGAGVSFATMLAFFETGQAADYANLALRIPGFFVGLLIGAALRTGRVDLRLAGPLGCALLLIFYVPYTLGVMFSSFLVGLSLIAAYVFLVRPVVPATGRRILSFLGVLSLEIFLIHQPLIREYNFQIIRARLLGAGLTPAPLALGIAAGLAVTLVLSYLLHRLLARLPVPGRAGSSPRPA